jgi:hypothetical protein
MAQESSAVIDSLSIWGDKLPVNGRIHHNSLTPGACKEFNLEAVEVFTIPLS